MRTSGGALLDPRVKRSLPTLVVAVMIALLCSFLLPIATSRDDASAALPCPCSLWSTSTTPGTVDGGDPGANVELGVKFTSDLDGFVTGVRFYKAAANTGPHTGTLWSSSGTELASGTFAGESASGWQQMLFASPVAVTAGTTYVVSYHTTAGHYSIDVNFFTSNYDNAPLHAPSSASSGGNGVFVYGSHAFPTDTFQAANYWVDVVFATDTTPPQVTSTVPADGASDVPTGVSLTVTFNEAIQPGSGSFTLTGPGNTPVAGSVAYTSSGITFTPSSELAPNTTYTATVSGVLDLGGNAMSAPVQWSFTTSPASTPSEASTPPSIGIVPSFTG
jgi:hypothetical protein